MCSCGVFDKYICDTLANILIKNMKKANQSEGHVLVPVILVQHSIAFIKQKIFTNYIITCITNSENKLLIASLRTGGKSFLCAPIRASIRGGQLIQMYRPRASRGAWPPCRARKVGAGAGKLLFLLIYTQKVARVLWKSELVLFYLYSNLHLFFHSLVSLKCLSTACNYMFENYMVAANQRTYS